MSVEPRKSVSLTRRNVDLFEYTLKKISTGGIGCLHTISGEVVRQLAVRSDECGTVRGDCELQRVSLSREKVPTS